MPTTENLDTPVSDAIENKEILVSSEILETNISEKNAEIQQQSEINEIKSEVPSEQVNDTQEGGILTNELEELENGSESEEQDEDVESGVQLPLMDYSVISKEELLVRLEDFIENQEIEKIRLNVENIKTAFYKKHRAKIEEKKKIFIEAGGEPEAFISEEDPHEIKFKELYKKYKELRTAFTEKIEKEKQDNLQIKNKIIEEIKELVNSKESINKTYQNFRDLQKRWRETGAVPQTEVGQLWQNYHHQVEQFYDVIKINQELRDLDLKKNLEEKIRLCERSEELIIEPEILKAFKKLQGLHDQWREIGPVPRDKKEEVWERFKQTTATINKKHQDHFDVLKAEFENNLEAKTMICEKAEEIIKFENKNPKEWEERTKELVELQKLWKTIGPAPKKNNAKVFMRFKETCDTFFNAKKDFFKSLKEEQNNNLQLKIELCIQVEGIKDSSEWKKTTDEIITLQKKWKEIGSVPNKHSDLVWKRFRAACDAFFNRKEQHFASQIQEEQENLKLKNELIEKIEAYVPGEDNNEAIVSLKEFQNEWMNIGHVPIKMKDELQKKFREAINKHYSNLNLDRSKTEMMQFKNRIQSYSNEDKPKDKIYSEKLKINDRIRAIEGDLHLWENNIGFFSKSKNAEALIKDFNDKIQKAKSEIQMLKERVKMLDNIKKE
ncbi:MAG: hypothetical protein A2275_18425 [Bacteroidetes bacterium RIFOXYA12_FULL_35_11]|nr:MAG: hypothetical protein A2X01_11340 [Bacteroidetes bacterium GWF2_35_48]OFY82783.1 MAG: hypothetical protein A2275_18425 [Bacteroidetes bacterium RIFOXYA12_FULL_35_11]OFZ01062.1 MAG: hypothetical protein A2491_17560 [Bacteroidetes bacterium RIFOXYC12_FULL_35_7]